MILKLLLVLLVPWGHDCESKFPLELVRRQLECTGHETSPLLYRFKKNNTQKMIIWGGKKNASVAYPGT